MTDLFWRKCSNCKAPIGFDTIYWVCNISTCNRKRTGLYFCSVDCWDAHLPIARHKDAWAEDRRSPKSGASVAPEPKRIDVRTEPVPSRTSSPVHTGASPKGLAPKPPDEILVVASKVKAYVRARSGMNTSTSVMDVLSDRVRRLCDDAIRSAQGHERKTVLDRDL